MDSVSAMSFSWIPLEQAVPNLIIDNLKEKSMKFGMSVHYHLIAFSSALTILAPSFFRKFWILLVNGILSCLSTGLTKRRYDLFEDIVIRTFYFIDASLIWFSHVTFFVIIVTFLTHLVDILMSITVSSTFKCIFLHVYWVLSAPAISRIYNNTQFSLSIEMSVQYSESGFWWAVLVGKVCFCCLVLSLAVFE